VSDSGTMRTRRTRSWLVAALVGLSAVAAIAAGVAGPENGPDVRERRGAAPAGSVKPAPEVGSVIVSDDARHDTSPPLRSIPPSRPGARRGEEAGDVRGTILPHPTGDGVDPVVQGPDSGVPTASAPTVGVSFDGPGIGMAGFTMSAAPPDTSSAVGPDHIVTAVNTSFVIQSKTGAVLYGPAATNTIWNGFGGACQNTNDGDPVARYDVLAGRFVVTQFANVNTTTGPFYECVAVSSSGDPTGTWYRYAFSYAEFPDYPKLGVWPDAYYVTYNTFTAAGAWVGPKVCALDRSRMLTGGAATQQCFNLSPAYGAPLPADVDSGPGPAPGSPIPMVSLGTTGTSLVSWSFAVDWANPANSAVTGPTALTVASYTPACGGGTCIAQPGTTTKLDSLGDRLMNRFAYRNLGSTEALLVSHSVTAGSGVGVRWYELRRNGTTLSVYQQGTYAIDSTSRWMPSVAMDRAGNIAAGYSAANGSAIYPSVRATGRLAGDALGTMTQAEVTLVAGAGSQTGTLTRWGDYATMSVDPVDQCTFWFATEYLKTSGAFNWSTGISSFRLPGCTGPIGPDFAVTVSPSTVTAVQGTSTAATVLTAVQGTAQTVALSVSGLPAGATATINPTSVTAGGSATLTVAASSATPVGTYTVTVTGTAASGTRSGIVTLVVSPSAPPDSVIVNGNFEAGTALTGWTKSGTVAAVTSPAAYSGSWSGRAGSTVPTNGDSKFTTARFTVPSGRTTLSFWYRMTCPDSITYDWATATLTDNTAKRTTTVLPRTCTNGAGWKLVSVPVIAGRSYTLVLVSHDDNYANDATFTQFDQVRVT